MTTIILFVTFIAGGTLGLLFGLLFRAGSTNDAWLQGYLAASREESLPDKETAEAQNYTAGGLTAVGDIVGGNRFPACQNRAFP